MAATTAAVVGGVASAASAASSMSQGGSGPPKWQMRNQRNLYDQTKNMTQQVAGFTPDQLAAQAGVRDMQGEFDPAYAESQANASRLAQGVTAEDINLFKNPYENDVIGAYLADLQQMRGMQDASVSEAAQKASAFGGGREAVYRASIQGDLDRTGATTLAGLRSRGWDLASQLAMQNAGAKGAGNQQLANLIGQRANYRLSDLNALYASGAQQQQLGQRQLDAPLDTIRFRSEINNPGSYQQTSGPSTDPVAGALSGFQNGYQGVQQAIDWWNQMRAPAPSGGTPV